MLSNSRYEILTIHTSKTLYNILMRLLIIEDEPKIARIIAEALRREHHAVDVTHDGDEGLNMAMSEPYDLLDACP